jgi:pantoate--beta-alanine ligase
VQICTLKSELRAALAPIHHANQTLGLVPTMGYLHDGHMELVRQACAQNDHVAASIFVNPTQFGSVEDLDKYPRSMERDLDLLRDAGVSVVFTPTPEDMYHPESQTIVETTNLAGRLMGELRPGHFRGVATVVTKLFNLFQPTRGYFGEKDYQQLAVIRTMVRDLDIPLEIVGVPTVREADGLAMSSRNARLSPEARTAAPVLFQSFAKAEELLAQGHTVEEVRAALWAMIEAEPLAVVKSVDIQDAETLSDTSGHPSRDVVVLLAAEFAPVLLIDQHVIPIKKETP